MLEELDEERLDDELDELDEYVVRLDDDADDDDDEPLLHEPLALDPDSEWESYSSRFRWFATAATAKNFAPVRGMSSFDDANLAGCLVSTRSLFVSSSERNFDFVFSPMTGQHIQ